MPTIVRIRFDCASEHLLLVKLKVHLKADVTRAANAFGIAMSSSDDRFHDFIQCVLEGCGSQRLKLRKFRIPAKRGKRKLGG